MKRTYRRLVATGMAFALLVSSVAVQQPDAAKAAAKAKVSSVKVTNVKKKKLSLEKGKTFTLKTKVSVKPNKAKFKKVTYKSSNKKVVTVSKKGKLKAIKQGKAKITVKSKTNKKKKVTITITVKKAKETNTTPSVTATPTPTPVVTAEPTATAEPTKTPKPTKTPTPTPVPTQLPDGKSTLMRKPFAEQAYVGTKLADVEVKSGSILDSNGNEIAGSYVWDDTTTTMSKHGKTYHKVKFVPTNKIYAEVKDIKIPVITIKKPLIITKPAVTVAVAGKALSSVSFAGGGAKDKDGNTVAGKFSWADGSIIMDKPGKKNYAAVFTPNDNVQYRKQMIYVKLNVTGSEPTDSTQTKKLDLTGGVWKNAEAYTGQWQGSFYNLTPYINGIDMNRYSKVIVEANVYDTNNQRITDTQSSYVGFKLANQHGDWRGFSDAYVNSKGSLSLGGYSGGDLYLVAQNMTATVGYIEIVSVTLESGSLTNVNDGSSLKLAFEDTFGKVGNAIGSYELNNFDTMRFIKSQYNSITMGNEMKPDYLLGGNPTLSDTNPAGYVDPSTFESKYMDNKYFQINMNSLDQYMEAAYSNGLKMRFHVFVWHQQTPKWFFKKNFDAEQGWVTPEVMNGRLEYYIRNVMTHIFNYKNAEGVYIGREVIDNWDMANEYMHNCDNDYKSYWDEVYFPEYKHEKDKHSGILTPVYIKKAFAIGHELLEKYDLVGKISLVYNDYNTYLEADNIVNMVNYFNTKDELNPNAEIICDGVGTQMHLDVSYPTIKSLENDCLIKFKEAGFEIQPTEMDITDYKQNENTLLNQYKYWYNLMLTLMVQKDSGAKITGVVWWGLADNFSWRIDGVPLLFSTNWQAKDAYFNVMDAVSWYSQGDTELQR